MTILKKSLPSLKELTSLLQTELNTIHEISSATHKKSELKKQDLLNKYKNLKSKNFEKSTVNETPFTDELDPNIVENLININHINSSYKQNYLNNVITFLSSQRQYQYLLERYNPGLTMTPTENLTKSANRVGFSLPQQK